MEELLRYISKKAHVVISVPAILCFLTFITNMVQALKDGNIDTAEFHQLLASADGFETVVLFLVAFALKARSK